MSGDAICDMYGAGETMETWCVFCGKQTMHDISYVGTRCHVCRLDWSAIDGEIMLLCDHIKQVNKWTWNDFGLRMGLKGSTVRTYAWKHNPKLIDHMVRTKIIFLRENTQ